MFSRSGCSERHSRIFRNEVAFKLLSQPLAVQGAGGVGWGEPRPGCRGQAEAVARAGERKR